MISGGTESACTRFGIAGFCAMRALSTSFNNDPEKASRPWDKKRDGFVLSEGSGMIVLEELEHAKKDQRIYMLKLLVMVCLAMLITQQPLHQMVMVGLGQ